MKRDTVVELINITLTLFFKYSFMYFSFLLAGRSFMILVNRYLLKSEELPDMILDTKSHIFYPIIGCAVVGNFLILFNFFSPLKNNLVYLLLLLFILVNLFEVSLEKIKTYFNISNFFYFIFIPSVILVSSSDINFHYDSAYYHLNNQNWLRESNLITGFVNIFWPFGMSSIYEYLSAILWFQDSLIYLHFLSLLFIHVFFAFIYFQIFTSTNTFLRNGSIFLIIFSILDNFGFSGGRNGFIYIQEVGKQDISVAILICLVSICIINKIKSKNYKHIDLICISLLCLFVIQIKVSSIYIFFLYICYLILFCKNNLIKVKNLIFNQSFTILFSLIWLIKNYLSTGCFIYPSSFTCINSFDWYIKGSTEKVEAYTSATSFAFLEYFIDPQLNILDWFNDFFNSTEYAVFSDYYFSVYSNFIISFIGIIIISFFLFKKNESEKSLYFLIVAYVLIGITYLIFYGPIPRYTIGIICLAVMSVGFFRDKPRFELNKSLLYFLFIVSISLLPRFNSYINLIETKNIALSDPRPENNIEINFEQISWVRPIEGDRCWIDLSCTHEDGEIKLEKNGYFYTAFKEN